jgi:hypothetical protein
MNKKLLDKILKELGRDEKVIGYNPWGGNCIECKSDNIVVGTYNITNNFTNVRCEDCECQFKVLNN